MVKENAILKGDECGLMVLTLNSADCTPTCCGKEMEELVPKVEDTGNEKHRPVVTKVDGGIVVTCGEVAHPMEEAHHIEWLSAHDGEIGMWRVIYPGEKPEAFFPMEKTDILAYAYCNLHGLWINK